MLNDISRARLIEWSKVPKEPWTEQERIESLNNLINEIKCHDPKAFLKEQDLGKRKFFHKPMVQDIVHSGFVSPVIEQRLRF